MRTTVTLDDKLVADATELTGITDRTALLRAALTALVQRTAARQLALAGGSDPAAWVPPRRRPMTFIDPE